MRVQLRRPKQEREEVVIIEAPDAMRAGRFEVVCCLQRAHDVEVAVKQAEDERGVVGFCDYTELAEQQSTDVSICLGDGVGGDYSQAAQFSSWPEP